MSDSSTSSPTLFIVSDGLFLESRQLSRLVKLVRAAGWRPQVFLPDTAGHLMNRSLLPFVQPYAESAAPGIWIDSIEERFRDGDRIHIIGLDCAEAVLTAGCFVGRRILLDLTCLAVLPGHLRIGRSDSLGARVSLLFNRIADQADWTILMPKTAWIQALETVPVGAHVVRDEISELEPVPPKKDDGVPVVLMPTLLSATLGGDVFAQVAAEVGQLGIPVRFALSGQSDLDDPDHIPVTRIKSWEDAGYLEWWDRMPLHTAIGAADIILFPSRGPVHYRALSHALAMGKPIVATTVGGFDEYVRENVNGFLVPPDNVRALCEAIVPMLLNEDRRKALAAGSPPVFDETVLSHPSENRDIFLRHYYGER